MSDKITIFLFTRDLRLHDNSGLINAIADSKVMPVFIFNPKQYDDNDYFSANAFQFMLDSLFDLDFQLQSYNAQLNVFNDDPLKVLNHLISTHAISNVSMNKDYTPFALKRERDIKSFCEQKGVVFTSYHDHLLFLPEETVKKDGAPYSIFTPFYKNLLSRPIREPQALPLSAQFIFFKKYALLNEFTTKILPSKNSSIASEGGRRNGLNILSSIKNFSSYKDKRDIPSLDSTTRLSAHHKFGTVSIRESYYAIAKNLGAEHPLSRQLYWRDFFTMISYFHPSIFKQSFQNIDESRLWDYDLIRFKKWCEGKTGFPIVDAGMRQLVMTGYMHNRVRMITASFLTKDLHIDWRWGEQFFAKHLIDYDPSVNNGSWQWAASTGCDAQPYFRIFNPWRQQKRFDPQAEYIKYWVDELSDCSAKQIHNLENSTCKQYPSPIVVHADERKESLARFSSAKQ
ncbi:MAG: cryptochrome/photolyase family protein [Nanobdellota archaeon]